MDFSFIVNPWIHPLTFIPVYLKSNHTILYLPLLVFSLFYLPLLVLFCLISFSLVCENTRYVHERIFNTYGRFRTNYTIRYTVRTDFPAQITRNDTQYVRVSPYKLNDTIHYTYGSLEVSKGSRTNNTHVQTLNVCTQTVLVTNSTFCYYKIK